MTNQQKLGGLEFFPPLLKYGPYYLAYLCSLSEGLLKSFGGEGGGFSNNVAYYRERTICMDLEKNSSKIDSELVKSSDDTLLHEL